VGLDNIDLQHPLYPLHATARRLRRVVTSFAVASGLILLAGPSASAAIMPNLADLPNSQKNADPGVSEIETASVRVHLKAHRSHELSLRAESLQFAELSLSKTSARRFRARFSRADGRPLWHLLDASTGAVLAEASGHEVEIRGEKLQLANEKAPERMILRGAVGRETDVLGLFDLERYVAGVVSSEAPANWPMEMLKAQAIAVRSFTLARLADRGRFGLSPELKSTILDQVFEHQHVATRSRQAVEATQGRVLVDPQGRVAMAFYHSDCGGATSRTQDVWGGGNFGGTAVDAACPQNPKARWSLVRRLSVIARELKREGVLKGDDQVVSMVVAERDASDRARRIRVKLSDGREVEFSGERLRSALGYGALKSTRFEMLAYSFEGESAGIQFQGRGFGHGVGLCQWGARHLAEKGKSAEEILAHYYPRYSIRGSVEGGLAQATATLE